MAQLSRVSTGVVVVSNALNCGMGGRVLAQLNALNESVPVRPLLLSNWPETGRERADRMFTIPYRMVTPDAYQNGVESTFRNMPMPFVAV